MEYEISGWIKPLPRDASQKFMSLAAKPKEQRQQAPQQRQQREAPRGGDDLSDVPF